MDLLILCRAGYGKAKFYAPTLIVSHYCMEIKM